MTSEFFEELIREHSGSFLIQRRTLSGDFQDAYRYYSDQVTHGSRFWIVIHRFCFAKQPHERHPHTGRTDFVLVCDYYVFRKTMRNMDLRDHYEYYALTPSAHNALKEALREEREEQIRRRY